MKIYAKQRLQKFSNKIFQTLFFLVLLISGTHSYAQRFGGPVSAQAPGRAEAPIDLTGTWVSLVTEDWAYRMVTPAIGDTMSVPVNEAGNVVTNNWDLQADNAAGLQCKAFGAARIMRVPTRLQISWQDDYILRIDSDAGSQTRLLNFSSTGRRPLMSMMLEAASLDRTWQGYSVADWENILINRGSNADPNGEPPPSGTLKVITTQMLPGYLRPNGIPYSADTILTEYFNRFTAPTGEEWFVVTTIVDDPMYLFQPYVTTSHFRRELDNSKWSPSDCETWAPPEGAIAPGF
ncbi:MAG: hypothetical protein P8J61_01975 [Gammaproteobacteria bacterium]|jgi:hypothetical protein|nr:hypothetical protein [Gammaproteobacteria bacterium]